MKATAVRGAVIAIEGADRVGKSTRAAKLVDRLSKSGERVQLLKFPDRDTEIGGVISRFLQQQVQLDDRAIHLLFSANRWEWFARMRQAVESGVTLVIDRYAYSGVAYSSAKPGLDLEWCKQADSGLIKADAVLYMTVPDEVADGRPGFGDEVYERSEFQRRVKKRYEQLHDDSWTVISGDAAEHLLDERLLAAARCAIERASKTPLAYLW